MIKDYSPSSLMPNDADPLIFFQDIKTELAHILENSRQHQIMGRASENQTYIRSKAEFVDGYFADLFNMIVARIRATQAYLDSPDTEAEPFGITRYKNGNTPVLDYDRLNTNRAINVGRFDLASTRRFTGTRSQYTHTSTYRTTLATKPYASSQTAVSSHWYTSTTSLNHSLGHFSHSQSVSYIINATSQTATISRVSGYNRTAIAYTETYEDHTMARETRYTYTRDSSSTHFSNTQSWTMKSSGRTSYISGRRTISQGFSNTQSWTMRSSSSIRYATYTRANTKLGWQSTYSTNSGSGVSTTTQTTRTLPFSYTASSLYTRTSTFSSTNQTTTRITGYGTSGAAANATSYRETHSTIHWWATSKNASSTRSSEGIQYNTSRTSSSSGTLTTRSSTTTLPTMEQKANSFYTRTLTFSVTNASVISTNIGYRSNGQSLTINNTIPSYVSSLSQTIAYESWSATSKNSCSMKPGTLLGAWQTTSSVPPDGLGQIGSGVSYGTFGTSLSNNNAYTYSTKSSYGGTGTSRITGYGTSGTVSNATSYRETMQYYTKRHYSTRSTMNAAGSSVSVSPWYTISSSSTVREGMSGSSFLTLDYDYFSTVHTATASRFTITSTQTSGSTGAQVTSTSEGNILGSKATYTSYTTRLYSSSIEQRGSVSTSYNTFSSGTTVTDIFMPLIQTTSVLMRTSTLYRTATLLPRGRWWHSSSSSTYQSTFTETL